MKPNQVKNRKLNLNKQTIQKLNSSRLASVHAGEQANTAVGIGVFASVVGLGVSAFVTETTSVGAGIFVACEGIMATGA